MNVLAQTSADGMDQYLKKNEPNSFRWMRNPRKICWLFELKCVYWETNPPATNEHLTITFNQTVDIVDKTIKIKTKTIEIPNKLILVLFSLSLVF